MNRMVLPAFIIGQNLYSLYHILQAVRDRTLRETWTRKQLLSFSSIPITLSVLIPLAPLWVFQMLAPVVLSNGRDLLLLAQVDARWASVYAVQTFTLTALGLLLLWILKQEASCICVNSGHTWKCSRGCRTPAPSALDTVAVPLENAGLRSDIYGIKGVQTIPI
jgi:hypothetical protein